MVFLSRLQAYYYVPVYRPPSWIFTSGYIWRYSRWFHCDGRCRNGIAVGILLLSHREAEICRGRRNITPMGLSVRVSKTCRVT